VGRPVVQGVAVNALYKVESGASKKRKREKEQEYWNSLNGPVTSNMEEEDD